MRIVFEPSGTHVQHEVLKARLDLYADVGEKSYAQNYVLVPVTSCPLCGQPMTFTEDEETGEQWWHCTNPDCKNLEHYDTKALPHIYQLNPSLSVFVAVGQDVTKALMTEFVGDVWTADKLATIDDIMSKTGLHESAHLISPYMNGRNKARAQLSTAKTLSFDDVQKGIVNQRLSGFSIGGQAGGKIEEVRPQSIDVGNPAVTGDSGSSSDMQIASENSANADGNLDTFEVYLNVTSTGGEVGTAYVVSGDNLTSRDKETVGNITGGSKQSFTDLTIDVVTGDYASGWAGGSGQWAFNTGAGNGRWYKATQTYPFTNTAFTFSSGDKISIYAAGTEAGGGTTYEHVVTEDMTISTGLVRANCSFQNVQRDAMVTRTTQPTKASFQNSQLQTMVANDLSKGGISFQKSILEMLRHLDLARGNAGFQNAQRDSLVIDDATLNRLDAFNSQRDSAVINDLSRGQGSFQNSQLDSLVLNDGSFTQVTFNRTVLDLIRLWDAPWGDLSAGGTTYEHVILDSIRINDAPATNVSLMNALRDSLALDDSPLVRADFMNAVRDSLVLLANDSITLSIYKAQKDSLVLNDLSRGSKTSQIRITESAVIGDGSFTQVSFAVIATDAMKVVDAIATAVSFYSAVADSIVITDLSTILEEGATRTIYVTFKLRLKAKTLQVQSRNLTLKMNNRNLTTTLGG